MDAIQTFTAEHSYLDQPPVLISASSEAAQERAVRTVTSTGRRIAGCVPIEAAMERIDLQISATAVWIELDRDCGGAMDALLTGVSDDVRAGRYAAVVSSTRPLVDAVAAGVDEGRVEFLVDADEAERAAALAIATSEAVIRGQRLSDIASDQNAARLRQLSDEVSRIAATLSRLSAAPPAVAARAEVPSSAEPAPEVSADTVRGVIRARRLRTRYFADHLFADPAWDMLLDLFQAEIAQLRVPVSSLCIAAAVPATTALRWLKTRVEEGIFIRRADPHDGRRVFVELAPASSDAMRRYFAEVGKAAAI
ncbi:MAG TPA: MarR family transcriptional regulator [Sphingomicrobium sp.]|jgi:DNA-binding MarR family transcriptional regulator